MNGYVYFCNDCTEVFLYQSLHGSTVDKHARRCPYCGSKWITEHHLNDMKWSNTDKTVEEKKKPMTLVEFSNKLVDYTNDLSPCPFCKRTENLCISIITVEDSDMVEPMKAVRISCDGCNLSFDSPVFPEASMKENRYEEALSAVANHCQAWDIRGDNINDGE